MTGFSDSDAHNATQRGGRLYWFAAAALLFCIIAYGLALHGPLFFDDDPNLLQNPQVQIDGRTFDEWRIAALSSNAGILHRPVAMLSFALNHALAGEFTPFSLKATNLVIHLLIGALLYFFAQAVLRAPALRASLPDVFTVRWVALLAAALWLLHPIHVSTVLYAIQRMAQLSTLFTLSGLLLFMHYRLRWAESGASAGEVFAAGLWLLLFCLLAVLSKENGVLLPWLVAVVEVTLFRGIWRGQRRPPLAWFGVLALCLPLLLIVAVTVFAPDLLPGSYARRNFTLYERLLTQARILWQYLAWMLFPNIMQMGFFHDDIPLSRGLWSPLTTGISLLAWGAVLALLAVYRTRFPLVAFAFLFYLVAHSMESSVLPLEMVFEHRNYLPGMGFALLAAVGIQRCAVRFNGLRLALLAGGILVVLCVLLAVRTSVWRDELTLARFEVINHPQSARANFLYGNALYKRFAQSRTLGLGEEEERALAVAARSYFERMHTLADEEFAALVMLYQLDTSYFPRLATENDWLGVMQERAKTRRLSSSDRTALGALVEYALTPAGEADRDKVESVLLEFCQRYPANLHLFAMRYKIVTAGGDSRKAELLPVLQSAAELNPGNPQAPAYLAQYYGAGDLGTTYEAIREWMKRDSDRRELPQIREIFK